MFGSFDPQDLYGSCGHIGQPSENLSNLMRSMLYYNAHLCVIISKFVSFVFTPKTTLFKLFYQRTLLKIPDYTVSYTFHFFFFNATGWQEFYSNCNTMPLHSLHFVWGLVPGATKQHGLLSSSSGFSKN